MPWYAHSLPGRPEAEWETQREHAERVAKAAALRAWCSPGRAGEQHELGSPGRIRRRPALGEPRRVRRLFRLTTRFDAHKTESDRRFKDSEDDRRDLRLRLESVDRDAVRKADLATVKTEIIERVKEAEHNFRNDQAKAIGEMTGMSRTLLEKALGARP